MKITGVTSLLSTERKFGLIMAACFGLVSLVAYKKGFGILLGVSLGLSSAFILLTLLYPRLLGPIQRYWLAFGERISVVVSFIIVTVVYFSVVLPLGLLRRGIGVDKLGLKLNNRKSMWRTVEASNITKPF